MPKSVTSKDEIASVCTDLFTRHGYAYVSVKAIAEELGISKATIYHHYPTKESVLIECAQKYHEDFLACLKEGASQKVWLNAFYGAHLDRGCFMFNMMACEDTCRILIGNLSIFTRDMRVIGGISNARRYTLVGVLLSCKLTGKKTAFNSFIDSL